MRKNVLNLDDDNTHKKTSFFSFCYSTYLQLFLLFHPRIPQMYNITGLQKLCDILLENPSWTIAHLIVFFNLAEHINHSKVADLIDEPDYATNMTPIQVCCWTMVQFYWLSLAFVHVLSFCHIIVVTAVVIFLYLVHSLLKLRIW